jgi:hypothetical protein
MYVPHALLSSSRSKSFEDDGRIAIWDKNQVVFVIAMGIWVTDISILINGKYLLQITGEPLEHLLMSQVSYG